MISVLPKLCQGRKKYLLLPPCDIRITAFSIEKFTFRKNNLAVKITLWYNKKDAMEDRSKDLRHTLISEELYEKYHSC